MACLHSAVIAALASLKLGSDALASQMLSDAQASQTLWTAALASMLGSDALASFMLMLSSDLLASTLPADLKCFRLSHMSWSHLG